MMSMQGAQHDEEQHVNIKAFNPMRLNIKISLLVTHINKG